MRELVLNKVNELNAKEHIYLLSSCAKLVADNYYVVMVANSEDNEDWDEFAFMDFVLWLQINCVENYEGAGLTDCYRFKDENGVDFVLALDFESSYE